MRERGSYTYAAPDLAWFEQEWRAGREASVIAAGMRRRGYEGFTADRARWLARYHGLTRPQTGLARKGAVTVETVVARRLAMPTQPPADNAKAAVVERHPVPSGGYRILV